MSLNMPPAARSRPDWPLSALVFLALLALYGMSMCRTVYWYDSAELAAASAVLGIPHPPGYPLYTLLGRLYVLLFPGEPAVAVNAMSVVHGALGIALLLLVQRQLGADRWGALLGALALATSPSYWLNSSIAEVYTTGIVFLLITFALVLRGVQSRSAHGLVGAAFVGGLGFSAHMFVATTGLGLAWLVGLGAGPPGASLRATWPARLRTLGRAALATLAGASLYLYIPIRAAADPPINGARSGDTDRLLWIVTGGNYKHWFLTDYDPGTRLVAIVHMLAGHLSWLGLVLGVAGLVTMLVRERAMGVGFLLAILGNLCFFFAYDVHDLEVFFLPAAAVLALCAGLLVTRVRAGLERTAVTRAVSVALVATGLAYFGLRAWTAHRSVDFSSDRSARVWGEQVAASLPRDAAILDFSTPPEWQYKAVWEYYFQRALGFRPDVLTLTRPPLLRLRREYESGRPVYVYAPDQVQEVFEVTREGPLYRIRLRQAP